MPMKGFIFTKFAGLQACSLHLNQKRIPSKILFKDFANFEGATILRNISKWLLTTRDTLEWLLLPLVFNLKK